jgi:hypothetical protein
MAEHALLLGCIRLLLLLSAHPVRHAWKKKKRMETNALYTIWRYKAPIFKLYKNNFDFY